jgi:hypothetical protein
MAADGADHVWDIGEIRFRACCAENGIGSFGRGHVATLGNGAARIPLYASLLGRRDYCCGFQQPVPLHAAVCKAETQS